MLAEGPDFNKIVHAIKVGPAAGIDCRIPPTIAGLIAGAEAVFNALELRLDLDDHTGTFQGSTFSLYEGQKQVVAVRDVIMNSLVPNETNESPYWRAVHSGHKRGVRDALYSLGHAQLYEYERERALEGILDEAA